MESINSKKDFLILIARERARSERVNGKYSIIIFDVREWVSRGLNLDFITGRIHKRVRCYDDIGWIGKNRIAVLLPYAEHLQAVAVADRMLLTFISDRQSTKCVVLEYPLHWPGSRENTAHAGRKRGESVPVESMGAGIQAHSTIMRHFIHRRSNMPLWKRLLDIVIALSGIMSLMPLFALFFVYIKIVSPGPVFFRQKRIGYLGRSFTCLKFRTMHTNASIAAHNTYFSKLMETDIPMKKLDDADLRIIPLGKFLRKSGADELPQLLNVLAGDMSVIGPRPCIPYEAEQYKVWQRRRFDAVPGLTGLWQVSGKNRTTFNEMMRYDIAYAMKKSFWLDVTILLKTIPAIFDQLRHRKETGLHVHEAG